MSSRDVNDSASGRQSREESSAAGRLLGPHYVTAVDGATEEYQYGGARRELHDT